MTKTILICAALAMIVGCRYMTNNGAVSVVSFSDTRAELLGTPCKAAPPKAELLAESGALALFAGETAEDSAYNEESTCDTRKSLFLRRRKLNGKKVWTLLLTTGSDWREPAGMSKWCSTHTQLVKSCFCVSGRALRWTNIICG